MLQSIRERSKGVVAWIIVILIIIPFALWGVDQFTAGDKIEVAAKVDGEPILAAEVARKLANVKAQYQQQFGDMYSSLVKEDKLKQQVLDDLIQSKAMDLAATEEGLAVSDAQLNQLIHAQRMFQEQGQFSVQRYEKVLAENRFAKQAFEQQQRQFMLRSQYESMVGSHEIVLSKELQALADLEVQEREVGYLRVDHRPFVASAVVSDEMVQSYYNDHIADFKTEDKVSVEYIRLSLESLMQGIQVTDEALKTYYQDHPDKIQLPEKRNARHILIGAAKNADAAIDKAAKDKAESLLSRIKKGEDFASLAKENSEDPGSASNGGELGFFQRGDMVPVFETTTFALKNVGDVSDVVRSDYGYHIIQLVAIEPSVIPAFEKAKPLLVQELKSERATKLFADQVEKLKTVSFEQDDSLQPAAQALGLTVESSPLFGRDGGEGVFAAKSVVDAAFSQTVMVEKKNSALLEVDMGDALVLRIKSSEPARERGLAEVKGDIQRILARNMAVEQSANNAKVLLATALSANDPAMLVKPGIEWKSSTWLTRSADQLLPEIAAAAFKAPKPKDGKATWVSQQLSTGDTVLIRVSGVRVDSLKRNQVMKDLTQAAEQVFADATTDAFASAIKAKAKTEVLMK